MASTVTKRRRPRKLKSKISKGEQDRKKTTRRQKRIAKQTRRQNGRKELQDEIKRERQVRKDIREEKKQQGIQQLNDQTVLFNKINEIERMINSDQRMYLDPHVVDILDRKLLNTLKILHKLKPFAMNAEQQCEYLVFGWVKNRISMCIPSPIQHIVVQYYGSALNSHNGPIRTSLIKTLTHQTNKRFRESAINMITYLYPNTKKMHRPLSKILKQYRVASRRNARQVHPASDLEEYTLMEIGSHQICYESTCFVDGFPLFLVEGISDASSINLSILGNIFHGMATDFTPVQLHRVLDKLPLSSHGIIQFYNSVAYRLPAVENDKSLSVYSGWRLYDTNIMTLKKANASMAYKVNKCFLGNQIHHDWTNRTAVIWSQVFVIKHYVDYYYTNTFHQQFDLPNGCIDIIKSFVVQDLSFLFPTHDHKMVLFWFLHLKHFNDEWLHWIAQHMLCKGSITRHMLSVAVQIYNTSGFVANHLRNRKLWVYMLDILNSKPKDIDYLIQQVEIMDYETMKYILDEWLMVLGIDENHEINHRLFMHRLLSECCFFECCLYSFVKRNSQHYIDAIMTVYAPTEAVIGQILNAAIREGIHHRQCILNMMAVISKGSIDTDWALFLKAVLLHTTFHMHPNLMEVVLETTIKHKIKSREDKSIFQYVFLEHVCKTKMQMEEQMPSIAHRNLNLFFAFLLRNQGDLKKYGFDINVGVLYCAEYGTDCVLKFLLESSFVNYKICKERGYIKHLRESKEDLTVEAKQMIATWCESNGESFSSCIVM